MNPNLAPHLRTWVPTLSTGQPGSEAYISYDRKDKEGGGEERLTSGLGTLISSELGVCRLGVAGRQRARIPVTATPVSQNFPRSLGLDYLDVTDFSDKTELRWFESFKVYPKRETFR